MCMQLKFYLMPSIITLKLHQNLILMPYVVILAINKREKLLAVGGNESRFLLDAFKNTCSDKE